ncbi:MAG: hypothetical protein KDK39_04295 [Leptospiraceae bacterium]|nr:hypothetical protein [Leptospiraceae bacterium]
MNEQFDWYIPGTGYSCSNGDCTSYKTTCEGSACQRTKCNSGKCTTTFNADYLQKYPHVAERLNGRVDKRPNNTASASLQHNTFSTDQVQSAWTPTLAHKFFMHYQDLQNQLMLEMQGKTTALQKQMQLNFDRKVLNKKIALRGLCLMDVEDRTWKPNQCRYMAKFYLPKGPKAKCISNSNWDSGYYGPYVTKYNLCKSQALHYQIGKRYDISGKITEYRFSALSNETYRGNKKLIRYFSDINSSFLVLE